MGVVEFWSMGALGAEEGLVARGSWRRGWGDEGSQQNKEDDDEQGNNVDEQIRALNH